MLNDFLSKEKNFFSILGKKKKRITYIHSINIDFEKTNIRSYKIDKVVI